MTNRSVFFFVHLSSVLWIALCTLTLADVTLFGCERKDSSLICSSEADWEIVCRSERFVIWRGG